MEVPKVGQGELPGIPPLPAVDAGQRYKSAGQEVLCCGEHYADAVNPIAADNIAYAMNAADVQQDWAQMLAKIR